MTASPVSLSHWGLVTRNPYKPSWDICSQYQVTSIEVHNRALEKVRVLHSGCGCKNPRSAANLYERANRAIAYSRRNNVPNLMGAGG